MNSPSTSRIAGFYDLSMQQRLQRLRAATELSQEAFDALHLPGGMTMEGADHMIENVIGVFGLPLGLALNFQVNGREVLVPMAIEEPSVVAGASYMAKLVRSSGGFQAGCDPSEMIGQIQVLEVPDLVAAAQALKERESELLAAADETNALMVELGGGARQIQIRTFEQGPTGPMLVLHLIYDSRDAMGANSVNTALERIAPLVESISGGRSHLRILSNLADHRLAWASCRIPAEALAFGEYTGEQVCQGIVEAWAFAEIDPYRAATHNKGIMNGIDAVLIATGNDWRAVEAGAHAYAARSGRYAPLSRWWADEDGALVGELKLPMALGTVGGATQTHPLARACLELMGTRTAGALAEVVVSVGLAQNLAALRALATEGIQRGHMELHARQVAIAAGAKAPMIERIARQMVAEEQINLARARDLIQGETSE